MAASRVPAGASSSMGREWGLGWVVWQPHTISPFPANETAPAVFCGELARLGGDTDPAIDFCGRGEYLMR